MKYILTLILTIATLNICWAQALPERSQIRKGNRAYNKNNYKTALECYDKAHEVAPDSFEALYNYANALHKDEQYAKAEELYSGVEAEALPTDADRADLFYNLGNSQFMQQKYQEALESYKSSMRADPTDREAKYNYAYTKKLMEDQQNEDQQDQNEDEQDQNQDEQNDQGEDEQDQNGDPNEDQGDQDQDQDQGDQPQDQKDQPQNEQEQQGGISPQEQQQMLDAIQAQEDKTQEKLEGEEAKGIAIRGKKNW